MLHNFLKLLLATSFFSSPANALLNGKRVYKKSQRHPVVALKIRSSNEITRCTGSFVSNNTIITAAHCFDPTASICGPDSHCKKNKGYNSLHLFKQGKTTLWIDNKPVNASYTVLRHPEYRSTQEIGYENYDVSNNDLSLIILSSTDTPRSFVRIAEHIPRKTLSAWTYGAGMTKAKLYNNPVTGEAYNIEENVGPMKKQKTFLKLTQPSTGLIEVQSELVGHHTENYTYNLSVKKGTQVLSADSGGPLIYQNQLIGIVRNFAFSFSSEQRSPQSVNTPFPVSGKSIFTYLGSPSHRSFFNLAKRFGGKVHLTTK